jgi:hypothetical protein
MGQVTIESRRAPGRGGEAGFHVAVLRDVATGALLERDGRIIESNLVLPAFVVKAGADLAQSLGFEVATSQYDEACASVDTWRASAPRGVRRVSVSHWSSPECGAEVRAFATDRLSFVAEGRGDSLEAATIDLAGKLAARAA